MIQSVLKRNVLAGIFTIAVILFSIVPSGSAMWHRHYYAYHRHYYAYHRHYYVYHRHYRVYHRHYHIYRRHYYAYHRHYYVYHHHHSELKGALLGGAGGA